VQPEESGLWGFIDPTGKMVIPPQFSMVLASLKGSFSEGLAAVQPKENGLWGFIDPTGKMVIPPQFNDASYFSGGLAPVILPDSSAGYIDETGEMIWPNQ